MADVDGFYSVRFSNQDVEGIIAQCWTRDVRDSAWIQLASATDTGAPDGVVGCIKQQDGADVLVAAVTYAYYEVLVVAVAGD